MYVSFENVDEINLMLSLFKKAKNSNFDFCYLMANDQLKCGIICGELRCGRVMMSK